MKSKSIWLTCLGLVVSFIAGFWVANSLNSNEINQLRSGSADKPANPESSNQASGSETTLSAKEISDRIAEADKNPTNISFQKNLGLALYKYAGMRQDADILAEVTRLLDRVYVSDPKDYEAIVALGNSFFDIGLLKKDDQTFKKSRKYYEEALKLNSKDLDVSSDLALTYSLASPPDTTKAIEMFKENLRQEAEHEKSIQGLAQAYITANSFADAEKYIARLEKINPQNPRLSDLKNQLTSKTQGDAK